MVRRESCADPAGGSPVRVIAGEPGSRHQPWGEIPLAERCVESLVVGGSEAAGRATKPLFEADFLPSSYGFRPKRSATQALEAIREAGNRGLNFVLDADIQAYFDSIDQEKLLGMVAERISDRRVLKLLRKWLEAGVMEEGTVRNPVAGTPQGGVISPLLANVYLHYLDRIWAQRCKHLGVLIRYADDFVLMCGLRTTVRYPAQATPRRSSVSRVQETCTHGLKGGPGTRLA